MRHLQVADAARASLGLPVLEYTVTDRTLEVIKTKNITLSISLVRSVPKKGIK